MAEWIRVCALEEIPVLGSRVIRDPAGDICVIRNGEDELYALHDRCPHKGGPLSQGIVHGRSVTCPLHAWKIDLASGEALAPDAGRTHCFPIRVDNGDVLLEL